ncbi:MAG: hypothetical protein R2847_11445 [Bacteroidia bacterium]
MFQIIDIFISALNHFIRETIRFYSKQKKCNHWSSRYFSFTFSIHTSLQSFRMKLNLNDSGQFSFVTNYLKVWFLVNVSGYSSWYDEIRFAG